MTIKQQGGIFGRNPSFNDVEANSVDATSVTADSITIPSGGEMKPYLDGIGFSSGDAGFMLWDAINTITPYDGTAVSNGTIDIGAFNYAFKNLHLTGNVIFRTAGSGIDFSATSGTGTSELFDDYEEGTWTPVLGGSSGTSGQTYAKQVGLYTKIGNTVHAQCYVQLSAEGTVTGSLILDGLPFASANVTDAYGAGCISQFVNLGSNVVEMSLRTNVNASYAFVFGLAAAATGSGALSAPTFLTNSTVIAASLTYKAA